jgi:hypothetical protein
VALALFWVPELALYRLLFFDFLALVWLLTTAALFGQPFHQFESINFFADASLEA